MKSLCAMAGIKTRVTKIIRLAMALFEDCQPVVASLWTALLILYASGVEDCFDEMIFECSCLNRMFETLTDFPLLEMAGVSGRMEVIDSIVLIALSSASFRIRGVKVL